MRYENEGGLKDISFLFSLMLDIFDADIKVQDYVGSQNDTFDSY